VYFVVDGVWFSERSSQEHWNHETQEKHDNSRERTPLLAAVTHSMVPDISERFCLAKPWNRGDISLKILIFLLFMELTLSGIAGTFLST